MIRFFLLYVANATAAALCLVLFNGVPGAWIHVG